MISDECVSNLSKNLQGLRSLQSINMNFVVIKNFTDKGAVDFAASLKELTSLQSMTLIFGRGLSDKTVCSLSDSLQNLTTLKSIDIFFNHLIVGKRSRIED